MKVATCTPVDFVANAHFFNRDSGLLCRGFQEAGVECIVVMPGTPTAGDESDLVRTKPGNLSSPDWWRNLGADLVVLYAWGDPRYVTIASAIRLAGVNLIQSLDTAGLYSPFSNPREWWDSVWGMAAMPQQFRGRLRYLCRGIRDLIPALFEKRRLAMIAQSDFVAAVSPPAAASVRRYANALGFPEVAEKIILAPHPVSHVMQYVGEPKGNRVLAVGRWENEDVAQKDPAMLVAVLHHFLGLHPDWTAEVVGRGSENIRNLCRDWDRHLLERLILSPVIGHEELASKYCHARILLCPSRFESFHISSGEALCCGCSVVVAKHPLLASTAWFTEDDSGTLAPSRTALSLASALTKEVNAWLGGVRDPAAISRLWTKRLMAKEVASTLLSMVK